MAKDSLDPEAVKQMLLFVADRVIAAEPVLSQADRQLGDGDHGLGMARGFSAVKTRLGTGTPESIAQLFAAAGTAMLTTMGGASGALFGTMFRSGGKALEGRGNFDSGAMADFLEAAAAGVVARGGAKPGDKTLVDALQPAALKAREVAGSSLPQAASAAAAAAQSGKDATKAMMATIGRAKALGAASIGYPDPGAMSVTVILEAVRDYILTPPGPCHSGHPMTDKVVLCWSSGKDSAYALHVLRTEGRYEVVSLLTTMTEGYGRVSMHGVRRDLVQAQAAAAGLGLRIVWIPQQADNAVYEARMGVALAEFRGAGAGAIAFGDLFLEDLRKYREDRLAEVGMAAVFPIWKRDTHVLARQMIREGFRTVVTCVDTRVLDGSFAGRDFDESFLADLPSTVDPCGENGEFHSFCYAGPIFRQSIAIQRGEIVLRDNRFNYADVTCA